MTLTQITEKGIKDGEIINADINDNAAIAGSKINPSFTTNLTVSTNVPSISFADGNDNPDYKISANSGAFQIEDTTNNANRVIIQTDGTVDIQGNLDANGGLDVTGDITGTGDLTLSAGGTDRLTMTHAGGGKFVIKNPSAADLAFGTANANNELVIANGGNVGIGTGTPAAKFHISDTYHFTAAGGNNTTGMQIGNYDGSSYGVLSLRGSALRFDISGSQKMIVDTSGVDVTGAITSTGNLTITNTAPKIFLTDSNNTSDFSIQNENGNLNFYDETNTTSRIRIISTGKVGINHTSPSSRVEIVETHDSTGAGTHTKVLKLSTTAYGTGQGPKMEFGTTNTSYPTWIYGDICSEYEGGAFGGAILFRTNSGSSTTSVAERLRVKRDGNVRINNGNLQLYGTDNGVVGLGVDSATYGKVNIKVAGSDGSGSNNVATFSRESGSSAIELHFPAGGGINFNSTVDGSSVAGVTATSELLDDYEEGTFEPVLKRLMTNGVTETNFYTQQTRQGNYQRIGNRVYISARIHWNGGSTGSGSLIIANLPFDMASGGANEVPLVVGYRDGINYTNVTGYAAPGMNRFYVTWFDSNSTYAIPPSATDASGNIYFTAHYEIG